MPCTLARVGSSTTLVDLSVVSLKELRNSVDPVLLESESQVLQDASDPWLEALKMQSAQGGSGC